MIERAIIYYAVIDTTEFLHPTQIASFMFKKDAKEYIKQQKRKYKMNTYVIKMIKA